MADDHLEGLEIRARVTACPIDIHCRMTMFRSSVTAPGNAYAIWIW